MAKIILRENKNQEEIGVPLWYRDKTGDFIVSVVGSQGDTRMRISTPTKVHEVGFPAADFSAIQKNKEQYAKIGEKYLREMGYDTNLINDVGVKTNIGQGGWFRDSKRHSLAAIKGQRGKYVKR